MFQNLKCFKTFFVFTLGFLVVFTSIAYTSSENEEEVLEDDTIEFFQSESLEVDDFEEFRNPSFNNEFLSGYVLSSLPIKESNVLCVSIKMFILYQRLILFH